MSAAAVEIARRAGRRERAGLFEAGCAVGEALYGNSAEATRRAASALSLGRGRDVNYAAAFALAIAGYIRQSQAIADDLARDLPEETFVQFMYLPTLRALFALHAHDPAAAIQVLQVASRYDLALGGTGFLARYGRSIPFTFADSLTWRPISRRRRPPSFSGSSTTAASCSSIPWTRSRACNSPGR